MIQWDVQWDVQRDSTMGIVQWDSTVAQYSGTYHVDCPDALELQNLRQVVQLRVMHPLQKRNKQHLDSSHITMCFYDMFWSSRRITRAQRLSCFSRDVFLWDATCTRGQHLSRVFVMWHTSWKRYMFMASSACFPCLLCGVPAQNQF
jgi:hypothetical protein